MRRGRKGDPPRMALSPFGYWPTGNLGRQIGVTGE